MLSSRVATDQLKLIAKPHSEIATKSGIYLFRLHAAFDSASTVGFCTGLGFFFSWWHDIFPVWWFVVILMQQQGRKMVFSPK